MVFFSRFSYVSNGQLSFFSQRFSGWNLITFQLTLHDIYETAETLKY